MKLNSCFIKQLQYQQWDNLFVLFNPLILKDYFKLGTILKMSIPHLNFPFGTISAPKGS
jgi:hypothetical protein